MRPFKTVIGIVILLFIALLLIECLKRIGTPSGLYPTSGLASWYTAKITAIGESLTADSFTCALRRRDFGKWYKVCNTENGRCVVVRHNNWGPSWYLYNQGRIVDLSRAAFSRIADLEQGIIPITLAECDPLHNSFIP